MSDLLRHYWFLPERLQRQVRPKTLAELQAAEQDAIDRMLEAGVLHSDYQTAATERRLEEAQKALNEAMRARNEAEAICD